MTKKTEASAHKVATILDQVAKERTSLWDSQHEGLCIYASSLRRGVYDALYTEDGRKVGVAVRKANRFLEKNRTAIVVLAEAVRRGILRSKYPEALRRGLCWGTWALFLEWAGLSL